MSAAATIAAPPAERWHVVKDALTGWRTDDPDAYPRCSVNPEHQIRNGDHYAVSGIRIACLPCAGAPAPPAPTPAPERPRRDGPSAIDRQFGGGIGRQPSAPPAQTPVMAQETPPAPRMTLADYGKPVDRETRQCGRDGCEKTFTVRSDQSLQRFCTLSCSARSRQQQAPPKPAVELKPKRVAFREERTCPNCGETWTANANTRKLRYCGAVCGNQATQRARLAARRAVEAPAPIETPAPAVVLAPDGHDVTTCPNLCCADRRRAAGRAPLPVQIGSYVFPVVSEGRAPSAVREATE